MTGQNISEDLECKPGVQIEQCPVCKASDIRNVDFNSQQTLGTYPIYECGVCTHRFIGNAPADDELQTHYDDYFRTDERQSSSTRAAWRDRALAKTLVRRLPRNARVLDVGANFGETLLAMPETYTLEGVELSATAAAAASHNPRLRIHRGFFEALAPSLPAGTYDCVIALAVIEHVRDPRKFLAQIAALLRPGAIAVLMTGDYASWNAHTLNSGWSLYHCAGHLHFFSADSLRLVCSSVGLQEYSHVWAGPNPLTSRLPALLGRALHCQTTTISFPFLFGRRPYGDLIYSWCQKQEDASPAHGPAVPSTLSQK